MQERREPLGQRALQERMELQARLEFRAQPEQWVKLVPGQREQPE